MEKIGNILVHSGQISSDRLEEALVKSMALGRRLGWVLVEEGLVSEEDLTRALARQLDIAMIDLDNTTVSFDAIRLLPRRVAIAYNVLPVRVEGRLLTIAVADPTNITIDDVVRATTGYDVRTVVAPPSAVARYLEKYYPSIPETELLPQEQVATVLPTAPLVEVQRQKHRELEAIATVNQLIQSTLAEAVRRGSRGILDSSSPSGLDHSVAVHDGTTTVHVSVAPDLYGERIEVSVSNRQQHLTQLDGLGLTAQDARLVRSFLASPRGLVLVVGPAASGKTTTLYAALHHLRQTAGRIVTVEDPIAHPLEGVHQLPADEENGISLADMLNVARQLSPEVIMVSDLPSRGTARAALEAALDGNLVLAAMEASDAPSALTHLIESMRLPSDLVTTGLVGVIAQRLVRKIDPLCKENYRPDDQLLIRYFGTADRTYLQPLYHGRGCRLCDGGYRGRTGLFQILPMTHEIRALIQQRASAVEIADAVTALGIGSLADDGLEKALNGLTTLEEMDRAVADHQFVPELIPVAG